MKLLLYWICTQLCSFMKSAKDWIVHSLCFRYNLIFTKEDLGYNTIDADFIGDCVSGYIKLHNKIVEACSPFSFMEYRLQKEKIVPGTGLRHSKSRCSPLPDTMGGNLPGVVGRVLQAVHQQVASGIHRGGGAIRRLVESLNLCLQGYNFHAEKRDVY